MSYADRAKSARQNAGYRPPEGDYETRIKSINFAYGKGEKKSPMFVFDFKVKKGPDDATTERFNKNPDKGLRIRYILTVDFHFDALLVLLEDAGANLSNLRPLSEDPEYLDFRTLMDDLEKRPPDCTIKVSHRKDDKQYYDGRITKIERVLGAGAAVPPPPAVTLESLLAGGWTREQVAASPAYAHLLPPAVPAAPVPPAPPAPPVAPVPPAPAITLEALQAAGWSVAAIAAAPEYAHLVPVAAPVPPAPPAPPAGGRPW